MTDILTIAGKDICRGERKKINLEVARLYDFTEMNVPVEVVRGEKDGPTLFVCAAIHGDEINGVEIIKRILKHRNLRKIHGTLIAVPIVNVFGFNTKSRYLPDRRDLNRCFPGLADGSLASQLAHIFTREIVSKATHGIDLHTGAIHRSNLPQIRGNIDDPETRRLAEAFGVPVIINSAARDGSLREAARERNIPILLYEGGEALRFNEPVIKLGIQGIFSVMHAIGMLPDTPKQKKADCFLARSSHWVRAPHSGTLVPRVQPGDFVTKGDLLGTISDPFGDHHFEARASHTGIIIGMTQLPLMNEGDAAFHIATSEATITPQEAADAFQNRLSGQTETFTL